MKYFVRQAVSSTAEHDRFNADFKNVAGQAVYAVGLKIPLIKSQNPPH